MVFFLRFAFYLAVLTKHNGVLEKNGSFLKFFYIFIFILYSVLSYNDQKPCKIYWRRRT